MSLSRERSLLQAWQKPLAQVLSRTVIAVTDGLFLAEQVDDWDWDLEAFVDLFVAVLEAIVDGAPPVAKRRR